MRRFIDCFIGDLKYMVFSWRFLLAVVGYVCVSFASILDEINRHGGHSVFYLYIVYYYYPFWILFLLFAVIPGSGSFCSDWENRYWRYRVLRFGKKIYAFSKAIACFCSAGMLVFCGQWIFFLVLHLKWPMYYAAVDEGTMRGRIYYSLMSESGIWLFLLVQILIKATSAGFFAVLSLWISTKITNIFVVLASPIITYYLIDNLTIKLGLPFYISITRLMEGAVELRVGVGATLLYAIGVFTGLSMILIVAFYFSCKRRVENG